VNRILCLAVIGIAPMIAQQQTASVEGIVISTQNGQPVRRAAVIIRPARASQSDGQRNSESFGTETDSNGRFVIEGIIPG